MNHPADVARPFDGDDPLSARQDVAVSTGSATAPSDGDAAGRVAKYPIARRFLAAIVDATIFSLVGPASIPKPSALVAPAAYLIYAIYVLLYVVVFWVAMSFLEQSHLQASPGKLVCKVIVSGTDGRRISFRRALLRNATKTVFALAVVELPDLPYIGPHDQAMASVFEVVYLGLMVLLPLFATADFASSLFGGRRQWLHDRWADVVVIARPTLSPPASSIG